MIFRDSYLPFGVPDYTDVEIEAVAQVMRKGWVGVGQETFAFEHELAEYTGANSVVAVNSCTSALFLSLRVLGIGPGDEVIVPSLTWCSTANAVLYLGATPIFCDVDLDTMSAMPETIESALTERTRAVIHVHYGGFAADMDALRAALPPSVAIVEDAAHALGATYPNGKPVGSSGNLVCFSFYANKNLSTGDGGAVACNDIALIEHVRLLSNQGLSSDAWKRFTHSTAVLTPSISELGYKMNFTDLQAAIGRIQLKRQGELAGRRLHLARQYVEQLSVAVNGICFQSCVTDSSHARHLFVIRLPMSDLEVDRNELLLELRSRNIGASIHYAPLHTLQLYKPYFRGKLPNTEALMMDILTLPIGAKVSEEDGNYVIKHLLDVLDKARWQ